MLIEWIIILCHAWNLKPIILKTDYKTISANTFIRYYKIHHRDILYNKGHK